MLYSGSFARQPGIPSRSEGCPHAKMQPSTFLLYVRRIAASASASLLVHAPLLLWFAGLLRQAAADPQGGALRLFAAIFQDGLHSGLTRQQVAGSAGWCKAPGGLGHSCVRCFLSLAPLAETFIRQAFCCALQARSGCGASFPRRPRGSHAQRTLSCLSSSK